MRPFATCKFIRGGERVKSPPLGRERSFVEGFAMEERMGIGRESKEAAVA